MLSQLTFAVECLKAQEAPSFVSFFHQMFSCHTIAHFCAVYSESECFELLPNESVKLRFWFERLSALRTHFAWSKPFVDAGRAEYLVTDWALLGILDYTQAYHANEVEINSGKASGWVKVCLGWKVVWQLAQEVVEKNGLHFINF